MILYFDLRIEHVVFSNTLISSVLSTSDTMQFSYVRFSLDRPRLFQSSENSSASSISRLLDSWIFFSLLEIDDDSFRWSFILSIKREPEISSNNYFSPQRSDRFFFYTFSFSLSTPYLFDVEETSSSSRINFSSAPERCGFTQVSRVIFPCQTSSQKGAPPASGGGRAMIGLNLHKTKVYSHDVSPETAAGKGKSCPSRRLRALNVSRKSFVVPERVIFTTREN